MNLTTLHWLKSGKIDNVFGRGIFLSGMAVSSYRGCDVILNENQATWAMPLKPGDAIIDVHDS